MKSSVVEHAYYIVDRKCGNLEPALKVVSCHFKDDCGHIIILFLKHCMLQEMTIFQGGLVNYVY